MLKNHSKDAIKTEQPHLVKLCVGAESVEDLEQWVAQRSAERRAAGLPDHARHVTRHAPKRAEELLAGGSLYWVIKGQIAARQRLIGFEDVIDEEGVKRCALLLAPEVIRTAPRPKRPFQGWRYLSAADAPADLSQSGDDDLPEALREALSRHGVL